MLAALTAVMAIQFHIPAGDAKKTLREFASQANMDMLFRSDEVGPRHTHAVTGLLTPQAALRAMFKNTGLILHFRGNSFLVAVDQKKQNKESPLSPAERPCEPIILGGFYRSRYCDDGSPKVVVCDMCR